MGNQKRYQQWFQQCYLNSVENESLVCDLVRFVCGVYHPTNAVICSDVVPRWAVIGWLLNGIKVRNIFELHLNWETKTFSVSYSSCQCKISIIL